MEKIVKNQSSPIGSIQELKEEVSVLRNKLENYEHLSWLGTFAAFTARDDLITDNSFQACALLSFKVTRKNE